MIITAFSTSLPPLYDDDVFKKTSVLDSCTALQLNGTNSTYKIFKFRRKGERTINDDEARWSSSHRAEIRISFGVDRLQMSMRVIARFMDIKEG